MGERPRNRGNLRVEKLLKGGQERLCVKFDYFVLSAGSDGRKKTSGVRTQTAEDQSSINDRQLNESGGEEGSVTGTGRSPQWTQDGWGKIGKHGESGVIISLIIEKKTTTEEKRRPVKPRNEKR